MNQKQDQFARSLELTGGRNCDHRKPDLTVFGGAKIAEDLCVGGNVTVRGALTVNGQSGFLHASDFVAGTGITLTDLPNNQIEIASTSGGAGPTPFTTQVIYVMQGGNDMTGTGSISAPFATITHAMATITDALWEKRYVIMLGPGSWPESFTWKAWVFITGFVTLATRLTGTIDINDPSWADPGTHSDERSGAQNLNFSGTIALDFSLQSSQYGKFYFWNCNMNNTLVITGVNPINQCLIQGGVWFGGITATGTNVTLNCVDGQAGTFSLTSTSTACSLTAFGGGLIGNLSVVYTGSGVAPTATLIASPILGTVTITGVGATVSATNDSLPPEMNIAISGGGALVRLTDAFSLAYTPTTPGQWVTAPSSLQNAIDRMATKIYTLGGNVPF